MLRATRLMRKGDPASRVARSCRDRTIHHNIARFCIGAGVKASPPAECRLENSRSPTRFRDARQRADAKEK